MTVIPLPNHSTCAARAREPAFIPAGSSARNGDENPSQQAALSKRHDLGVADHEVVEHPGIDEGKGVA